MHSSRAFAEPSLLARPPPSLDRADAPGDAIDGRAFARADAPRRARDDRVVG